jgi:hypothetical protein
VLIREGSVSKDLHALAPLLTERTAPFLAFCTDDARGDHAAVGEREGGGGGERGGPVGGERRYAEPDRGVEKIRKGMTVLIREGSVSKDLHALAPLLTERTAPSMSARLPGAIMPRSVSAKAVAAVSEAAR